MPTLWKGPVGPVTMYDIQGEARVFPTLAAAVAHAARCHLIIAERFPSLLASSWGDPWSPPGRRVVLEDECGITIPLWRAEEERQHLGDLSPITYRLRALLMRVYDPERDFRNGPVPGVHRRRWGRSYRHIHTQAERRDVLGFETDLRDAGEFPIRVKIRARRKGIPTLWDDIQPARKGDGWKNYRKTQYKA